jgi:hypothetical protein
MKEITGVFIIILALISYIVMAGISEKRNMWGWIFAYWCVLFLKNFLDFLGVS